MIIDGVVNLVLGFLLLLFPAGLVELLGLPGTNTYFYASILGAVIFGIGIALMIEWHGNGSVVRGLGLGGAIAINFCGGGILLMWLILDPFELPLRGYIVLWSVATIVLAIGLLELLNRPWQK